MSTYVPKHLLPDAVADRKKPLVDVLTLIPWHIAVRIDCGTTKDTYIPRHFDPSGRAA